MRITHLLHLVPSMTDELEKIAEIFGSSEPDSIDHAAIPYRHRKEQYQAHIHAKSKEKPTGYGKASLVGGLLGAGTFGLAAGLGSGSLKTGLISAGIGGALGAGTGALAAHADKLTIEEAKRLASSPNKIDRHLAERILDRAQTREAHEEMQGHRRHQQLLSAIGGRDGTHEVHHHYYD